MFLEQMVKRFILLEELDACLCSHGIGHPLQPINKGRLMSEGC